MTSLRGSFLAGTAVFFLLGWVFLASPAAGADGVVRLATIKGSINPASADYLIQAIQESESESATALLIELDTPGGLVSSTKDIIQAMLNAKVPVIVYVAPRGAWASSAGTFITVAANIAAMAPGTSIGAAHPVGVGGDGGGVPASPSGGEDEDPSEAQGATRDIAAEKAENLLAAYMETIATKRNRNVSWAVEAVRNSVAIGEKEALELGVIDLVAENKRELLEAVSGTTVELGDGSEIVLAVATSDLKPVEMTTLQRLFNFLADPNVAVLLFMAGLIGLYVEVNNPGLLFPGIAGAVCLVLAAIAFQILPFSWVGLLLMLVGIALFVAEVFVSSFGLLFVLGLVCLLLGGTMVFDQPNVNDLTVSFWEVLVPSVAAMAVFGGIVVVAVGRSLRRDSEAGVDELIGSLGTTSTPMNPAGKVYIRGEYWRGESESPVGEGERVEVMAVEGLTLRVRPAASESR